MDDSDIDMPCKVLLDCNRLCCPMQALCKMLPAQLRWKS